MQNVVLATGNPGKVTELSALLTGQGFKIIAQTELGVGSIEETGLTFVENALLKARHAATVTGLPAIADDSGLAVDALLGSPGIYSSRYSGEEGNDSKNIDKLLTELQQVPPGQRTARFHCVLVYLRHAADPTPLICQAEWEGEIALQRSGTEGFGYDPVFLVKGLNCTAAELTPQQKRLISHRGQALQQLLQRLSHA